MIIRRPSPDANFFLVLRKRFLNLGGRSRAADLILAFLTLDTLCNESGIPDRLVLVECVASVSVAPRSSHELLVAQPTHPGSPAMHSTRQVPWRSHSRPPRARTAVASGTRPEESVSNLSSLVDYAALFLSGIRERI